LRVNPLALEADEQADEQRETELLKHLFER
jgi:hypothetical protein